GNSHGDVVRLVSRRDIDSGAPQVIVDDRTQYRGCVRHDHEWLAREIPRTDGLERCKTVVTRQDHDQRLLDENTVSQPWHPFFPSKKSCIDFSLCKAIREPWGVLTRYHHVDIRQFFAQYPQGFGHPGQFVSSQEAHNE